MIVHPFDLFEYAAFAAYQVCDVGHLNGIVNNIFSRRVRPLVKLEKREREIDRTKYVFFFLRMERCHSPNPQPLKYDES